MGLSSGSGDIVFLFVYTLSGFQLTAQCEHDALADTEVGYDVFEIRHTLPPVSEALPSCAPVFAMSANTPRMIMTMRRQNVLFWSVRVWRGRGDGVVMATACQRFLAEPRWSPSRCPQIRKTLSDPSRECVCVCVCGWP